MRKIILFAALSSAPIALQTPARAQMAAPSAASLPDVSKLEYRAVTLAAPTNRRFDSGRAKPVAAHLWVVPAREGQPKLGIGWDGAPYELQSFGAKAAWRADVEAFLKPPAPGQPAVWRSPFEFGNFPVALLFLERLGAPDLKRSTSAQPHWWESPDPQIAYLQNLRNAGVSSFVGGQFSQARRQLQTLVASYPDKTPTDIYNLGVEATAILGDIQRRTHDTPRPKEEIAGLIWDLQNVRAYQMTVPGSISWTENDTVQKLINEGDSAVEPLLDTLQNDDRLTLSFYEARVRPGPGRIGAVRDAAQSALEILLRHRYSATNYQASPAEQGANVAAQMRADWEKIKGQSPVDRIFNALAQNNQTPERLEEAARELVRKGAPYGPREFVGQPDGTLQPAYPNQPFFGEPLRTRQKPSVSDLLEARINELSQRALNLAANPAALEAAANTPGSYNPYVANNTLATANELAVVYAQWDPKRALPLLDAQLELTKTFTTKAPRGLSDDAQRGLNRTRRQFLAARLKSPFRAQAMQEYGEFLESQPFGHLAEEDYLPLWRFPDEPALIKAAHALFDAPRRPYEEAAQWKANNSFNYDVAFRLLKSPLIKTPIFKAAVLRELTDTTPVATLRKTKIGEAQIEFTALNRNDQTVSIGDQNLENGDRQPIRVADLVGFWLKPDKTVKTDPTQYHPLLDVALPTAKRDARLKEIAALVVQGRVVADDSMVLELEF